MFSNKKLLLSILILLSVPLSLRAVWLDVRGSSAGNSINISKNPGVAYVPSIAIDGKGYPHVVWYDNSSGHNQLYYLRWNGFDWVDAFGSAARANVMVTSTINSAEYPKLALDSNDYPHIVWEDGPPNDREIYYLYWDGTQWQDSQMTAGANMVISNTVNNSSHPAICIDASDKPRVSWVEEDPLDNKVSSIKYAQLNGTTWVSAAGIGAPATIYYSGFPAQSQSMVLDSSGRPCIAWSDGIDTNREIYLLRWNGSAWVDADGSGQGDINISNTNDYSAWPCVALDPSGNPHVVWEDDTSGDQNVYCLHWNGSAWVDVAGSASKALINMNATFHFSTVPSIKVDSSYTPHVIWSEGAIETCDIFCWKWNGSQWTDETGSAKASQDVWHDSVNSEWASFALDKNADPHVVWSDGVVYNHHDIYYMHWAKDGTATITPTINLSDTPNPTFTVTPTITQTFTSTPTATMSPYVTPDLTPPIPPCWSDADGVGWQDNPVSTGSAPVLRLDSQGRPNMVYINSGSVYFMKWNGFKWVDAGGYNLAGSRINGTVFNCAYPDLKLDAFDRPCVAWTGFVSGYKFIYYLHWNGSAWVDVVGNDQLFISIPYISGGYAEGVSLALDSAGRPAVVYDDAYAPVSYAVRDIFYFKWNGADWVDADGVGRESAAVTMCATDSSGASLAFDASDNPSVSWIYTVPNANIRYLKHTASGWADSTGSGTSNMDIITNPLIVAITQQELKLDNSGKPGMAFCAGISNGMGLDMVPCYIHYNGSAWTDATGASQLNLKLPAPLSTAHSVSLEYDKDGIPNIAWQANDGVYFARWENTHWEGADPSNPSQFKVMGNSNGYTDRLTLCLDAADHPALLWADGQLGVPSEVFLKSSCDKPPTPSLTPTITPTGCTPTCTPTATPAPVNIKLIKSAIKGSAPAEIIYTIRIKNDPYKNIYNLMAWDTLPTGVVYSRSIAGPDPVISGSLLTWDFGGGVVYPDEEYTVSFGALLTNPDDGTLKSNIAAGDYNDDFYSVSKHPAVYSNQAFFPEGLIAVYPNPYNPLKAISGKLKFVNLPPQAYINMYSLTGENISVIKSDNNVAYWDGKNSYGSDVSPGIYYYIIWAGNGKPILKGKSTL